MPDSLILNTFHPAVSSWFARRYGSASAPQSMGWPSISSGKNTLILAPTGSGKTLAAFLWAINHLVEQHLREAMPRGVRILYVSPLKALNNDIHRNLEEPLAGIREEAHRAGLNLPAIRTAVRTGDTPQSQRASMVKNPPDILITTPESLYLMLTSPLARRMFRTVQYVIVDEIHALCGNKRGVHLSISLERLQEVAEQEMVRIGLSATQKPLDRVAAYLGGMTWGGGASDEGGRTLRPRHVEIVDAGQRRTMDLRVECPIHDFSAAPPEGVWPLVLARILREIHLHRTTLIFVNNRRLAERIAARLNRMIAEPDGDGGPSDAVNLHAVPETTGWSSDSPELVKAYHGSMSRVARERMESELKAGKLRALVATSSLELGIDIGSIDLVLQLQSPKGVAHGLQRVGRSGHLVSATSKGRIFPTHREDLVESAVVARAMTDHSVESTVIPENCLDVLAQQIVAMVSTGEQTVDHVYDLVRQSYCYRSLSRSLYDGVIRMLAGRYRGEALRDLRAKVSLDAVNGILRPLPGTRRVAIMSGGVIADRGLYGVYLEDRKTRVGDVDEEFVFESRPGDTFILGTSVWRIREIDANRVTVAPAPGQPARMPFWKGEGIGRSFELGRMVGTFRRELSGRLDSPECLPWLQHEFPVDRDSAWNIQEYFRRQRQVTGWVPHDRLIVVEGFRDEIGDPRIVVHSAFGRRVNGLLALVLERRLRKAGGADTQTLFNDDGILLRCPDADSIPLGLLQDLGVEEAVDAVMEGLVESPMFGGQFRQNASRALLLPKAAPGHRTPLWLQRLRAGDLLQAARQFDDFPIVIETLREVLNDILDFNHFKDVVAEVEQGIIRVEAVQTEVPSPFAASLLLDFVAAHMYESDQPRSDTLSQYVSLNREILSEIVDLDVLRRLVRPEAIEEVEHRLQHLAEGSKARSPEELMEVLLRIGDLTEDEVLARTAGNGREILGTLVRDGRAVQISLAGAARWIAGEDLPLYTDLQSGTHARRVLERYLEHHGPVAPPELALRYGLPGHMVEEIAAELLATRHFVRGSFRPPEMPGADAEQVCYRPNIERIHRQTISVLRKEITPSTLAEFTLFLQRWQHLHPSTQGSGRAALEGCIEQLEGLPLPSEIWERDILRPRIRGYSSDLVDQATSGGAVVWVGWETAKVQAIVRGDGNVFLQLEGEQAQPGSEAARHILSYISRNGASFFGDLRAGSKFSLAALNAGIAELFWDGIITNDVFSELLGVRRTTKPSGNAPLERVELLDPRHSAGKVRMVQSVRRAIKQVPGWAGRWSLVRTPGVMGDELSLEERALRQAGQLLHRYGIVARELCRREHLLPWALIAAELQRMELRGEIRRGYFVEGLSGMQFALPSAVEELRQVRSVRSGDPETVLVNACDPANPYGAGVDLPAAGQAAVPVRVERSPGSYIAFNRGEPVLVIENHGARLWAAPGADTSVLESAIRSFVGMARLGSRMRPFREVLVEYCNGARTAESPLSETLRRIGFIRDRNQTMRFDGYG